jgi:hypothetical protein
MVRIRRFGVIRTANVAAVIYLILTAIFVIPFALILVAATPTTFTDQAGRTTRIDLSPVFLLLIPFLYAAIGWVFTAIGCLIYNLAARWTGGIEFEAIAVAPAPSPAAPPVPPYRPPAGSAGSPQAPGTT